MARRNRVVVVDGYSSGNFLPAAFGRLGVDVVAVTSTAEFIPSMPPPDLSSYVEHLTCPGPQDVNRTVDALREMAPLAVVAGQEPGVRLADTLSEQLGLPGNGTARSAARRDKFEMIETLRRAGLRCAGQFKSADPARIADWAAEHDEYPVVVKPLSSASSDNVTICHDRDQVLRAAQAVLGATTMFGVSNEEVLVQSYLDGTEYIVDTVSVAGSVYVCGVWEYEKTIAAPGRRVYDRDVLVAADTAPVPELIAYVEQVLAALDIRYGPAHAEVILTADGPALVEVGARLNGNMNPEFHDICLGANQADLIALAYARPGRFLAEYGDRVYRARQAAAVHNTSTTLEGWVDSVDDAVVDKIASLPTVHLVSVRYAPGQRVVPTADLMTSPLRIFMTGTDAAALRADHETIQHLKDQVYRLRDRP